MINFESIINECETLIHEHWTDGIALTFGTSAESYFINRGTVAGSLVLSLMMKHFST